MTQKRWVRALCVAAVLVLSLWPAITASTQGEIQVALGKADSSRFPNIDLPVTVLNVNGVPILDLGKDDFEALEDDVPMTLQTVTSRIDTDLTVAVALVIDISGSAPIEEIKQGANQFLDSLDSSGANNRVALIGFNWPMEVDAFDPTKEVPFTSNLDEVRAVVDGFVAEGGTAVYEAIYKAVLITADEPADRRAVIVMTDGHDTDSRPNIATADTPKTAAKEYSIPIFTVGAYQEGFVSDPDYLKVLARESGGQYQEVDDLSQLATLFQNVVQQLRTEYDLTVRTQQDRDGKDHVLKIRVNTPQGVGEAERTITYPAPPPIPLIEKLQRDVNGELVEIEPSTEVTGKVLLVPQISAENPLVRVEYYVDDVLVSTVDVDAMRGKAVHEPWEYKWDTCTVAEGSHTIRIIAYDDEGNNNSVEHAFSTTVLTTHSPWCVITQNIWLVLIIVAVVVIAVLLLFIILRRRREQVCPVCGSVMDPSWGGVCQFCAASTAAARGPDTISAPSSDLPEVPPAPIAPAGGYQPTAVVGAGPAYAPGAEAGAPAPPMKTERIQREPKVMGWLIMQKGPREGQEFRLQEVTAIGRSGNNDIIIDDSTVSRQHAKVRLEDKVFTIFDLGAANPTKVNGQEIGKHQLVDGDRVEIGNTVLVFKQVGEPQA